jgi:beta-galactosidase
MGEQEMAELTSTTRQVRLDTGWRFGGSVPVPGPEDQLNPKVVAAWSAPDLDDSGWEPITVPHTVVPLSWELWDASTWEKVWAYRRTLTVEAAAGERVFLDFDAAMTAATVTLNGTVLGTHRGGYLPFGWEITEQLVHGDNQLAVILDARFNINVPPNITSAAPSSSVDYSQPGGIHRDVWLRHEPATFVSDIALTHHGVMDPAARHSSVVVTIDSTVSRLDLGLTVELIDAMGAIVATARGTADSVAGTTETGVDLTGLDAIALWDVEDPALYTVRVTLDTGEGSANAAETVLHSASRRTGYREARFELDGFYLNGTRRYLLGVNRHGYYPYAAFAMPDRVHRKDAEIIRNELNCLMVRCSHYPQTDAFLDACDELGLLVWEESPGWQHVGDSVWQEHAVQEIVQMVKRDRHRPSVIVWGARLNETADRPEFYARTEAVVKELDPTRATSGTMHGDYSRLATFQHDVFSYDDYFTRLDKRGRRRPDLLPPVEDRPYLISETVSTRSSPTTYYRRWEHPAIQQHQALDYANMHNDAMGDHRYAGALAWGAFDYQTTTNNHYRGVKTSGLADVFRIPKPGAAIYRSQVDPSTRAVIEPAFAWGPPQFGSHEYDGRPEMEPWSPGEEAMICSNCDRLEIYLDDERVPAADPDNNGFPHLKYAPTFVDLRVGSAHPDLRIEGIIDGELVLTRRYSADRSVDSLKMLADDAAILADGVDTTRVTIMIVDRFHNPRTTSRDLVTLSLTGPGVLVGDPVIDLSQTGAVAAVWLRSVAGEAGPIALHATTSGRQHDTVLVNSIAP